VEYNSKGTPERLKYNKLAVFVLGVKSPARENFEFRKGGGRIKEVI
jgi:hypothetical protein